MAAAVPLLGPVLGLVGSLIGGKDAPDAPTPTPPPEPPPPPAPDAATDPQTAISAEADRSRALRRRKQVTPGLTQIDSPKTTSKTLLGE